MFVYIIAALVAVFAFLKYYLQGKEDHELLSGYFSDKYWNHDEEEPDQSINRFKIDISEKKIADLKNRLSNTRYPVSAFKNSGFNYGTRDDYMKELVEYWSKDYDWKKQEDWMNSFDHFKTNIEGLNIHFIHSKPKNVMKGVEPKILLMTHGWPGSVVEFLNIIPMLTDPSNYGGHEVDVFTVICPSIPGYGFSDAPQKEGFNGFHCARVFHKLMLRLGYKKYYVQGGDWGSMISSAIAKLYPNYVKGVHITLASAHPQGLNILKYFVGAYIPSLVFHPAEAKALLPFKKTIKTMLAETGYMHLQATKPDTVGFGLSDSPVGLAAYLVEKFSSWTDMDGRNSQTGKLADYWTKDQLLNNIMIYWWNNCITSSMRFYKDNVGDSAVNQANEVKIRIPSGYAFFPNEPIPTSRLAMKQQTENLVHFTYMPKGGHFNAFQVPADLVADIRLFVRTVEGLERGARRSVIEEEDIGSSQLDRVTKSE